MYFKEMHAGRFMYKHVPQNVIYNSKFGTNSNVQK